MNELPVEPKLDLNFHSPEAELPFNLLHLMVNSMLIALECFTYHNFQLRFRPNVVLLTAFKFVLDNH